MDGQQLYVIVWGSYAKVGCSVDPIDRLRRVTERGSRPPRQRGEPELVATAPGSLTTEAWLHTVLAPHRAAGEWFHLRGPVKDLVDFAQTGSTRAFPTFEGRSPKQRKPDEVPAQGDLPVLHPGEVGAVGLPRAAQGEALHAPAAGAAG